MMVLGGDWVIMNEIHALRKELSDPFPHVRTQRERAICQPGYGPHHTLNLTLPTSCTFQLPEL